MKKTYLKVLVPYVLWFFTLPIRILPIKKNKIVFTGLTGGKNYDYSCNPKYIYEYMKKEAKDCYEFVWLVNDVDRFTFLEKDGVYLAKHFSLKAFFCLLTTKVFVTNGSYTPWFPFRKNQYIINTWHGGGAYKKIENEKPDANWATKKRALFCARNIDLFVASCRVQEEQMIRTSYLYKGEVLQKGTPRNDVLLSNEKENLAKKVKTQLGLKEKDKIVLYAPTYRNTNCNVELDVPSLLKALNDVAKQDEKWVFLCRFHRYHTDSEGLSVKGNQVINVADYRDMQELLCAADIMITDYSSCVWDYAMLRKPCFLFVPDKEEYEKETGFYVGLNQWPFAQAKTMEELIKAIRSHNDIEYNKKIDEHLHLLGSYETGHSCSAIASKINEVCNS